MKKNHGCGITNTQLDEAKLDVITTQKPNAQSQSSYIIRQKSKTPWIQMNCLITTSKKWAKAYVY